VLQNAAAVGATRAASAAASKAVTVAMQQISRPAAANIFLVLHFATLVRVALIDCMHTHSGNIFWFAMSDCSCRDYDPCSS
jgi:hypothetical protein